MRRRPRTKTYTGGVCQECRQRIIYVKMTATGRSVPVDPIPVDDGNVCARLIGKKHHGYVISTEHPAQVGYTRFAAHFGTCPDRPRLAARPNILESPALFDLEDP